MDRIYLFFIRNDVWIYIVCGLGLFWYLFEFVRSQSLLRRAMYSLEFENAHRMRNHALSFILFFGAVITFVFYVNRSVAPSLPAELLSPPTPTPGAFATPLGTVEVPQEVGGEAPLPPGVPGLAPTVTLPAAPGSAGASDVITDTSAAGTPAAAPTAFVGCSPTLVLDEPLDGSVVFRTVNFRGSANTGEVHRYVIELNGPQTAGAWAPITQEPVPQPVLSGDLGSADLSQWQPGPYRVRLRALAASGEEVGQCLIAFTLDN